MTNNNEEALKAWGLINSVCELNDRYDDELQPLLDVIWKALQPKASVDVEGLKWFKVEQPDLPKEEWKAYVRTLPHSVDNRQACYTARLGKFDLQWKGTFWVGNQGHPLIVKSAENTKTAVMNACQEDLRQRILPLLSQDYLTTNGYEVRKK